MTEWVLEMRVHVLVSGTSVNDMKAELAGRVREVVDGRPEFFTVEPGMYAGITGLKSQPGMARVNGSYLDGGGIRKKRLGQGPNG